MPESTLASEVADKADETILAAEKSINDLAQRAEKLAQDGLEKLRIQSRIYAEEAERSIENAQKYVTERVHERPMSTTLIALGVGVFLGLLIGGRRR